MATSVPSRHRATARRSASSAALLATLILASCGDDARDHPIGPPTSTTAVHTTSIQPVDPAPPDTGAPGPVPSVVDLSAAAVSLVPIAELAAPIALVSRPGSSELFIAERAGRVQVLELTDSGDPSPDGPRTLVDISSDTTTDAERGLLSLTFSPDGSRLYLSYTDRSGATRIDEWRWDNGTVDTASRRSVLRTEQPFANHNGGHILFGPDGFLYLGLGDGGGSGDPLGASQDATTVLGSILRIDPAPGQGSSYRIPADNPFLLGGGSPEIWLIGVRNPWRFSFDRRTGDLWIADVGQGAVEEVTMLRPGPDGTPAGLGANLGWPLFEGDEPFAGGPEPDRYAPPLHTYRHRPGCSITGGHVSRGDALADLRGAYLYSDFCDPTLYAILQHDGAMADFRSLDVTVPGGRVVSFGEGPNGELYVLSLAGGIYRIDPG